MSINYCTTVYSIVYGKEILLHCILHMEIFRETHSDWRELLEQGP